MFKSLIKTNILKPGLKHLVGATQQYSATVFLFLLVTQLKRLFHPFKIKYITSRKQNIQKGYIAYCAGHCQIYPTPPTPSTKISANFQEEKNKITNKRDPLSLSSVLRQINKKDYDIEFDNDKTMRQKTVSNIV